MTIRTEVTPEPEKRPAWKNARLAAAIVAAVCVISAIFGVHRSMMDRRGRVEEAFYQGVDGSGYSIWELYQDRAEYAGKLMLLAEQYADQNEALSEAVASYHAAINDLRSAATIQETVNANSSVTDWTVRVDSYLNDVELSELHEKYRSEYVAEMSSYSQKISHLVPEYNDLVREFDTDLQSFPMGTIARLTGVERLEVHPSS